MTAGQLLSLEIGFRIEWVQAGRERDLFDLLSANLSNL